MSRYFLKVSRSFALLAALACLSVGLCVPASAQTRIAKGYVFQTLYSFATNANDGAEPNAGLIMDSSGALYGTASEGGEYGYGTVFQYASATNTFTTLHSFTDGDDGGYPYASLMMDSSGALYGTTNAGGVNGFGAIFKVTPATNAFATLYSFDYSADGAYPEGGLIMDSSGALYGTATGDATNSGTVFKYAPATKAFATFHSFSVANSKGVNSDGTTPYASLIMDSSGNLYGTALGGGAHSYGTIFKYAPATKTFTTLHSFANGADGAYPYASLIMDSAGNLYGTAQQGGLYGNGTVFKYAPATNTFTTLYGFSATNSAGENSDGAYPYAGLLMDSSGALYGTAQAGGENGTGTVFKYAPATNAFTTLHSFSALNGAYPFFFNSDGTTPFGSLIMDSNGALYGTALYGGASDSGTIFVLHPIEFTVPPSGLHPRSGPVASPPSGGVAPAP